MNKWKRAIYHLPPEGIDLLVCYHGGHMMVSAAEYYSEESKDIFRQLVKEGKMKAEDAECLGKFSEFGQKVYFDDPDVYWMELPDPPKEINELTPIQGKQMEEEQVEAPKYGEMTAKETADHFGEKVVPMEKGTDEIYAIAARIKNACVMSVGANLTPAGTMLCNTYTHTIKAFYDFAKTIKDEDDRERLNAFIKSQEGMAATFVSAAMANVAAVIEDKRKRGLSR